MWMEGIHKGYLMGLMLVTGLVYWFGMIDDPEQTGSYILKQMCPLVLLALLVYLLVLVLAWAIFRCFLEASGLCGLDEMGLQINQLTVCQKLAFYYACFALVLLSGVGVLMAVI